MASSDVADLTDSAAPILEVIATTVADALTAERGGADRLEIVSAMEHDGLTPNLALTRRIRDAVSIPLRVMLRPQAGFAISPEALDTLIDTAHQFQAAGIDQFELLATAFNPSRQITKHRKARAVHPLHRLRVARDDKKFSRTDSRLAGKIKLHPTQLPARKIRFRVAGVV